MKIKNLKVIHYPELSREEIIKTILNPLISIRRSQLVFYSIMIITFILFILTTFFIDYLIISWSFIGYIIIAAFLTSGKVLTNNGYDLEHLNSYLEPFKEYLACKGDRRDIAFLIDRIEANNGHYKKTNRLFKWCNAIYISFIFVFTLIIIAFPFSANFYSEFPFQSIMLLYCVSLVVSLLHWIRYTHVINLKQSKLIFTRIYDTELDQIYSDLRKITFQEIKDTPDDEILSKTKTWYDLCCGKYKFEKENVHNCQNIYYNSRLTHVKRPELTKFYDLLNILSINLLNEKPKHNQQLRRYLSNYISWLELKIREKTEEEEKTEKIIQYALSIFAINISVISLIIRFLPLYP